MSSFHELFHRKERCPASQSTAVSPGPEITDLYYVTAILVNHDRCLTLNAEIPLDLAAWLTFAGYADSSLVSPPPSDAKSHD